MINTLKFNPFRRSAVPPTWTEINETISLKIGSEELRLAHTLAAKELLSDDVRLSQNAHIYKAFYANDFIPVSFVIFDPETGNHIVNCRNTGKNDIFEAGNDMYQPWKFELIF